MAEEGFKRKLAAILSADVEGYSRLMDDNEEETVRTLTTYRNAINDLSQQYRGRIVDTPGDNILAEFTSVVDAVNCAVEIQRELAERNAELPYNRKMEFRIGVNLGDVIEEEGRIYGDGVNIAARVEAMAEAGGICISGRAYDQVENKLGLDYEDLGEHQVKNITRPISVYRVLSYPGAAAHRVVKAKDAVRKKWQKIALVSAAVLAVGISVAAIWNFYLRSSAVEMASVERMVHPLPDKPSIVVLPFDNLSKEPDQDYIVDGITDQIINGLSKIPFMFVIAKDSSLSYKSKDVEIRQISEELGVQYVLEGSVQVSDNRIRITAQLVDALSGHYLWSERYDRELNDIFELQDDIMVNIVQTLQLKVAGLAILEERPRTKWEALEKILKAFGHVYRWTKEDNALGRKLCEEAIAIDPDYGPAYRLLGWTYRHDALWQWSDFPDKSLGKAEELAHKAISLGDSGGYALLSDIFMIRGEYDKAVEAGEKALKESPNLANLNAIFSYTLSKAGRHEEAIAMIKKAIRLNPKHQPFYYWYLAGNYYEAGKYEEAIASLKTSQKYTPDNIINHIYMVACYSRSGHEKEALESAKTILELDPKFSIAKYMKVIAVKSESGTKRTIDALRMAGLPEHSPHKLPEKPSIAVLPFDNLSGDPEQDHLSDGISDQIIAGLAKIPDMLVIAKESSFSYKGKHVKVQRISEELGVQYVLEGSVLKSGDRLRITAQLIDGVTGHHLWSERYDRILDDLFAVLDDITMSIMQTLQLKVAGLDIIVIQHKPPFEAYEKILKGIEHVYRWNKEDNLVGQKFYKEAIDIDPEYVDAYRLLGWTYVHEANYGWSDSPAKSLDKAEELAQKALSLGDERIPYLFAGICHARGQLDKSIEIYEKGYAKNSNWANYNYSYAMVLNEVDRSEEAIAKVKKAMRLNPQAKKYNLVLSIILNNAGYYEEALSAAKINLEARPRNKWSHVALIWIYINLGRDEEAREAAKELLKLDLKFSSEKWANQLKKQEHKKQLIDALRKAGLPG